MSAGLNPTAPSDAAPGTLVAPLSTSGLTSPTFSIINGDGHFSISGGQLVAGSVPLDYTQATSETVRVRAEDGASAVEQTLTITVGPPSGPTAPTVDMNFLTQTYTGATLSNVQVSQPNPRTEPDSTGALISYNPNQARVNDLGLAITDQSTEYLATWSMDPDPAGGHWHHYEPGWAGVVWGSPVLQNGFNTVLVTTNDAASATAYTPLKRDVVAGEVLNIRARWKAVAGFENMGAAVRYGGTNGATALVVIDASKVGDSNNIVILDANTTLLGAEVHADGSMEVHLKWVVPASGPEEIGISMSQNATGAQMEYWGIQVMEGLIDKPWTATGATGFSEAGDNVTLTGPLAALLTAPTGTVVIEMGPPVAVPGAILSAGGNEALGVAGYTSARAPGIEAPVGIGGFQGITRVGLAHDGTGYDLSVNGGDVVTLGSSLNALGTVRLFAGLSGRVRRIIGWSTRLSAADLKRFTSITNRDLRNPGSSLNIGKSAVVFEDAFTNPSTIATRGAWPGAPGSWQQHMSYYQPSFDAGAKWMPGYVMATDERGGTLPGNNEWEWYADPEYAWADGYTGPFSFSNGQLVITAQKAADIGPNLAAQLPNRLEGSTDTGVPYPYVSGALTTAPGFGKQFGYFEMRAKLPKGQGIWPAFWLIPQDTLGGPPEIDIIEYLGRYPEQFWGTAHADYGADKVGVDPAETGIDLSQDFHTYAVLWEPGFISWYLDGKRLGTRMATHAAVLDPHPYYILVNLAVGDNGNWVGQPDATTPSPAQMVIDYIRVHDVG